MIQKVFNRRVLITSVIIFIIAGLFIYRLTELHFSEKILLNNPFKLINIRRGYITDRNRNILAISIQKESIYANPEKIKDPAAAAAVIASVLGDSEQSVLQKLKSDKKFVWIKRKVDEEPAAEIKKHKFEGIYFKKEFKRVYPNISLAANILGFTGIDNNGLEGVEFKMDSVLSGFSSGDESAFQLGDNLVLTIDKYIQYYAEKYLAETVQQYSAKQGAVIITDPYSGKIIAYAKYPSYDPNYYYKAGRNEWRNFAVVDAFEPGSTMKIFSMAALLKSGQLDASKKYNCTGAVQIGDTVINCTGVHGSIDIMDVIKYSCNVGVITSMNTVNSSILYSTLRNFGFGESTNSQLPGESSGILREVDSWSGLSKYSISIGQELSVTGLQMAAAYGAIANNGEYIEPSIFESIENYNHKVIKQFDSVSRGKIISPEEAAFLRKMLANVVDGGTGKNAASKNYVFGGKTGTAQKYIRSAGSYSSSSNVASFAGIAPIDNPKLVIIVIIDEPVDVTSGGQVAAPLFKKIAEKSLVYLGESNRVLKKLDPIDKKPVLPALEYKTMPDMRGMFFADALMILEEIQKTRAVKYVIDGQGIVTSQVPSAGTVIKNGDKIILYTGKDDE
ncbi:MAG: PASTA domain-containing protein [Spirochaetes bacterium]|nr:PASTA domain-containing protein [Spirochaetota bacterium]